MSSGSTSSRKKEGDAPPSPCQKPRPLHTGAMDVSSFFRPVPPLLVLVGAVAGIAQIRRHWDLVRDTDRWWRAPGAPPPAWTLREPLIAGLLFALLLVGGNLLLGSDASPNAHILLFLGAEAVFLYVCLVLIRPYGRTAEELGLAPEPRERPVGVGARAYLAFLPVLIGLILLSTGAYLLLQKGLGLPVRMEGQEALQALTDPAVSPGVRVLLGLFAVVGAPLVEEFFFRGMLYGGLRHRLSCRGAALASGIAFGAFHFDAVRFLPLAAFGVYLALLRERTGDLLVPMVVHGLNNLVMVLLVWSMVALG